MGLSVFPASTAGASRLVTKVGTAGSGRLSTTPVCSNTAGVFGSWAQLTASSSAEWLLTDISAVLASVGSASDQLPIFIRLGIGGAGSETTIWDYPVIINGQNGIQTNGFPAGRVPICPGLRISSGTRIAVATMANVLGSGIGPSIDVRVAYVPWANIEGN